jgi:hypothetical protein
LGDEVVVCPICGAGQPEKADEKLDNVDSSLSSSPSVLSLAESVIDTDGSDNSLDTDEKENEIDRLTQRGDDCFNSGKAWLGAKDRSRARKEFQRAFKYYETILKLDPSNVKARDNSILICLFRFF